MHSLPRFIRLIFFVSEICKSKLTAKKAQICEKIGVCSKEHTPTAFI